jgi:hypothetical protein
MKSDAYWQLFLQTGSPEAYLLYNQARRLEQTHVFEHQGAGAAHHDLQ